MRPFRLDRTWAFDVGADELWAILARTDEFPHWWPWLRECSGDGLVAGGRADCVIRAPVPYTLRFRVTVRDLVPGERVEAVVDGDLTGVGRLEVGPDGAGSRLRLAWELRLQRPALRAAARFGRPVMQWGHDWVVATGVAQFRRRALRVDASYDDHDDNDGGPGTTA